MKGRGDATLGTASEEERSLLDRARRGDRAAQEAIVRRHGSAAYSIVCAHLGAGEADDATQEVFLQVHRGLANFEERSSIATWIHRIATNVALNRLRRRRRKPTPPTLDEEATTSPDPGPLALAAESEARRAFELALATLPEEQRAVVVLRGVEGLAYEEVSRVLEIPIPTAQSRMSRAREKLRTLLARFLEPDARSARPVQP